MEYELNNLKIDGLARQAPFKNAAQRNLFTRWCLINDSLEPKFVSKKDFTGKVAAGNLIEDQLEGTSYLYLTPGLSIGELVPVARSIYIETAGEDSVPEPLQRLARFYHNAAIYLATRLDQITEGAPLAEELVREFFAVGQSINPSESPEITSLQLTPEETAEIDMRLAGPNLYQKRADKTAAILVLDPLENPEVIFEEVRVRTLQQYFRVLSRSQIDTSLDVRSRLREQLNSARDLISKDRKKRVPFDREKTKSELEALLEAWYEYVELPTEGDEVNVGRQNELARELFPDSMSRPFRAIFSEDQIINIHQIFNQPWSELLRAMNYRGLVGLENNLSVFYEDEAEQVELETLGIELAKARSEGKDVKELGFREREIISKVQEIVSRMPYAEMSFSPKAISRDKERNCAGASMLGGRFLSKFGVDYLYGIMPGHAILLPITSDGGVIWADMLEPSENNIEISDDDISDGTVARIVELAKQPSIGMIKIPFIADYFNERAGIHKPGQLQILRAVKPQLGEFNTSLHTLSIYCNQVGGRAESVSADFTLLEDRVFESEVLHGLGDSYIGVDLDKAEEFYYRLLRVSSRMSSKTYKGLARISILRGDDIRAARLLFKSIDLQHHFTEGFGNLGDILVRNSMFGSAQEMYEQALYLAQAYGEADNVVAIHPNLEYLKYREYLEPMPQARKPLLLLANNIDKISYIAALAVAGCAGYELDKNHLYSLIFAAEAIALLSLGVKAAKS